MLYDPLGQLFDWGEIEINGKSRQPPITQVSYIVANGERTERGRTTGFLLIGDVQEKGIQSLCIILLRFITPEVSRFGQITQDQLIGSSRNALVRGRVWNNGGHSLHLVEPQKLFDGRNLVA